MDLPKIQTVHVGKDSSPVCDISYSEELEAIVCPQIERGDVILGFRNGGTKW